MKITVIGERPAMGEEVLDGTLIHPEDYALAKKLADFRKAQQEAVLAMKLPPEA